MDSWTRLLLFSYSLLRAKSNQNEFTFNLTTQGWLNWFKLPLNVKANSNLDQFLQHRFLDNGTQSNVATMLSSISSDFGPETVFHPLAQNLINDSSLHIAILNDVFSLDKEVILTDNPECNNTVAFLMKHQGL